MYETELALRHEGIRYSVRFDRNDALDGRPCFFWSIEARTNHGETSGWETIAHGDDLRLGAADEAIERKALGSLFTFLGAYAESVNYGGGRDGANLGLFPESVRPIAQHVGSDGFALLAESVWPES